MLHKIRLEPARPSWKKASTRFVYFYILLVGMDLSLGVSDSFSNAKNWRSLSDYGLLLTTTASPNPFLPRDISDPPSLQDPVSARLPVSPVSFSVSSVPTQRSQGSNHLIHPETTEFSLPQPPSFDASPWRFGQAVSLAIFVSEFLNARLTDNLEPACNTSIYQAHQLQSSVLPTLPAGLRLHDRWRGLLPSLCP